MKTRIATKSKQIFEVLKKLDSTYILVRSKPKYRSKNYEFRRKQSTDITDLTKAMIQRKY